MGSAVTKLVFRPPKPTPIPQDKFFFITIPRNVEEDWYSSCAPNVGCSIMPHNLEPDISEHLIHDGPHIIPAFFLLRKNAKLTVLYSHGNAEDLGMMYKRMRSLAQALCVNILAYDYSGYGLSRPHCEPSEKMCYRNIEAVYSYLVHIMRIPSSRIVLYGRSLGSGPTCYLAEKIGKEGNRLGGVILHSPFLSIYRIVLDLKSVHVGDLFQNYNRARHVKCPVLIIHGEKDKVVPFWHAEELLALIPVEYRANPFFVQGAGHNGIEVRRRDEYVKRVCHFLETCVEAGMVPEDERRILCNRNTTTMSLQRTTTTTAAAVAAAAARTTTTTTTTNRSLVNQRWMQYGKNIIIHYLLKSYPPTVCAHNEDDDDDEDDNDEYDHHTAASDGVHRDDDEDHNDEEDHGSQRSSMLHSKTCAVSSLAIMERATATKEERVPGTLSSSLDPEERSIEIIDSSTREILLLKLIQEEPSCSETDSDGDPESTLDLFETIESWETDGTNIKDWSLDSKKIVRNINQNIADIPSQCPSTASTI